VYSYSAFTARLTLATHAGTITMTITRSFDEENLRKTCISFGTVLNEISGERGKLNEVMHVGHIGSVGLVFHMDLFVATHCMLVPTAKSAADNTHGQFRIIPIVTGMFSVLCVKIRLLAERCNLHCKGRLSIM